MCNAQTAVWWVEQFAVCALYCQWHGHEPIALGTLTVSMHKAQGQVMLVYRYDGCTSAKRGSRA